MASEPMTDERLYEIEAICIMPGDVDDEAWEALRDSLLEIKHLRAALERLRAENAVMRPMVEALADNDGNVGWSRETDAYWCHYCERECQDRTSLQHAPDCQYDRARAFLASAGQAAESKGE